MTQDDRYASFDYSSLIQWKPRLEREWPFLSRALASAPARHVLDVGCGTGEHARFLASHGFMVTGVDSSPAMLEKARASTTDPNVTFVLGDMRAIPGSDYGAALCLGNALPHLTTSADLATFAASLRAALLPGAPVVLQWLNYDRIEAKRERALPLTFLPDGILFMRLMQLHDDRRVTFMPTILRVQPDRDPAVEVVASQRVEIRGWRAGEVEAALREAGFASVEFFGGFDGGAFEKEESRDVICVARP